MIKLEMFHKNSIIKTNNVGKGTIKLHEAVYDSEAVIPVYIYNKSLQRDVGILYVKLSYEPFSMELFDS